MLTAIEPLARSTTAGLVSDDEWFSRWRAVELSRLQGSGTTYLDYTGAALHAESLVRRDADRLNESVLGNPHSESQPSRTATDDLTAARDAILAFLHASADEYVVVLTANTTAACRLVGESFGFGPEAPLILAQDNHNSVNGIREYARRAGAAVQVISLDAELQLYDAPRMLAEHRRSGSGLFAYPAQSNFSGVRHPLSLIDEAHAFGYRVLLDAAAFLPTASLDLSIVKPDFVALSLYKIAGYPTGIGALVARREALAELRRPWFSGGTVDWVTVSSARHQLLAGPERFEDGTPPFLAAGAVRAALATVVYADRERLSRHLAVLASQLLDELGALRHSNGNPLVIVHGPHDIRHRGATVAITLADREGHAIPFWDVEAAAREHRIAVRGGCFCNPGCAERAFGLADAGGHLDALGAEFTIPKFSDRLGGRAVGAIRLSMGLGSVVADVERVAEFLSGYLT